MTGSLVRRLALLGLGAALSVLVVQMAARADRATALDTAIRWDVRRMTLLVDRPSKDVILVSGWGAPALHEGVWSTGTMPRIRAPTSTADGDVELVLTMAGASAFETPLVLKVGDKPVAAWRPSGRGAEDVRVLVPRRLRKKAYEVAVLFDLSNQSLAGPGTPVSAIRLVKLTSRVIPTTGRPDTTAAVVRSPS